MKIYIDLIFLVNFIGDFLCLWLASALTRRISFVRMLIAAAVGGIFGVAAVLPGLGALSSIVARTVFAALITVCACAPAPWKELLKSAAVFVISSMALCGGAEFIGAKNEYSAAAAVLGMALLLGCALSMLRAGIYARHLSCEICIDGKKLRTYGFYDSGNRLVYGEKGERVIVADERLIKRMYGDGASLANITEWIDAGRLCRIAFVSAESGEMEGIRLDYARVGGIRYDDVILGICGGRLQDNIVLHSTMI